MGLYIAIRIGAEDKTVLGVFTSLDDLISVLINRYGHIEIWKKRDGTLEIHVVDENEMQWTIAVHRIELNCLVEL